MFLDDTYMRVSYYAFRAMRIEDEGKWNLTGGVVYLSQLINRHTNFWITSDTTFIPVKNGKDTFLVGAHWGFSMITAYAEEDKESDFWLDMFGYVQKKHYTPTSSAKAKRELLDRWKEENPDLNEEERSADSGTHVLKERSYSSKQPLYFRTVFGKEGEASMLGVIDESKGPDTGYDTVYADENMNYDFTDEQPKKFIWDCQSVDGVPQLELNDPRKGEESTGYRLVLYSLAKRDNWGAKGYDPNRFMSSTLHYSVAIKEWKYLFINGKMNLYQSAIEARKGSPIRLGGKCKWKIYSKTPESEGLMTIQLKDDNGCKLRSVKSLKSDVLPMLTLLHGNTVKMKLQKMEFG